MCCPMTLTPVSRFSMFCCCQRFQRNCCNPKRPNAGHPVPRASTPEGVGSTQGWIPRSYLWATKMLGWEIFGMITYFCYCFKWYRFWNLYTAVQISGMHYNELKLPCTFRIEGASHIQSELKLLTWDRFSLLAIYGAWYVHKDCLWWNHGKHLLFSLTPGPTTP